jgi:hypothetical protein
MYPYQRVGVLPWRAGRRRLGCRRVWGEVLKCHACLRSEHVQVALRLAGARSDGGNTSQKSVQRPRGAQTGLGPSELMLVETEIDPIRRTPDTDSDARLGHVDVAAARTPPTGHRRGRVPVGAGHVAPAIAKRPTCGAAQPHKGVAWVTALRVRVGEQANRGRKPGGTDPGGVGGTEQLVVVDGVDQYQLVLRAVAVAAFLSAHRAAPNASQNGNAVRKRDD